MSKKILIATEKPFAKVASDGIKSVFSEAGYDVSFLESYKDKAELLEAVKDVEGLIIRSDIVDKAVLEAGNNLKIVVRAGAGYDNVDLISSKEKDIVVMNTPGQNSNAVAELAFGMMLYLARNKFNGKSGSELKGKSIGIHAYGNVGSNIARIAKGFGMDVYAFDPFVSKDRMEADGVIQAETVEGMYKKCHYISLNLPKVKATIGFINYELMSSLKNDAVVVNTARKEVVCEESLKKIFAEKPKFKYATDIEPECSKELADNYPDRYFTTPKKMGAQTEEANINAGIAAAKQIIAFFEKGDRTFQVNK
ncbi:MAG: NAD(P)-dependent oxidoreductase [Candidatus Cloacimonetes bacterium]|nr:NAD(P)-dependent oxidoreductase [Candidatus Cloacimonadota bacterium]